MDKLKPNIAARVPLDTAVKPSREPDRRITELSVRVQKVFWPQPAGKAGR